MQHENKGFWGNKDIWNIARKGHRANVMYATGVIELKNPRIVCAKQLTDARD